MAGPGVPEIYIVTFTVFIIVVPVLAMWMILAKAGYSPWLGLLMLFPVLGTILLLYLAFTEWPIRQELQQLKAGTSSTT